MAGFKASDVLCFLISGEDLKHFPGGNSVFTDIGGEEMLKVLNQACLLNSLRVHCKSKPLGRIQIR